MIKSDQYVKHFDYETYYRAVAMRVEGENIGSPFLFEQAAALFTMLDMFTAAEGCKARAQYYRLEMKR